MSQSHPVQLIVLLKGKRSADHLEAVHAAALASVLSYAEEVINGHPAPELWEHWVSGGRERAVRMADQRTFERIRDRYAGDDHTLVRFGGARALAFTPVRRGSMARHLARLEDAGAKLPGRSTESGRPKPGSPTVVLNAALEMSTGEACVQAATALFAWFLSLSPQDRLSWYIPGCQFRVLEAVPRAFTGLFPLAAGGTRACSAAGRTAAFVVEGEDRAGVPHTFSA